MCRPRVSGQPPSRVMSHADLRSLLDDVPDTLEIILRRPPEWSPVLAAWRDAAEEASAAGGRGRGGGAGGGRAGGASGRLRPTPPTAPRRTARTPPRTRSLRPRRP